MSSHLLFALPSLATVDCENMRQQREKQKSK